MPTFYLSMSGVNIDSVISDTTDLSTIRGGGLMLLHAVQYIQNEFDLTPISTGASNGLFSFEKENEDEAENIRQEIVQELRKNDLYQHATFVIDFEKDHNDFNITKECLLSKNRFRQLQQPSLVWPAKNKISSTQPCEIDKRRPGVTRYNGKNISASVKARKRYGEKQKQNFYATEINEKLKVERLLSHFVNSFEELAKAPNRGNLNGKMAVIYLDGNKFGAIQAGCDSPEKLSDWDKYIKKKRAQVLYDLLGILNKEDPIRLETLLWGGDELIWVVPAWYGWKALQLFYQKSADWRYPNNSERQLTHAGGIVFCHYKAHIHKIVKLCKDLANDAKACIPKEHVYRPECNIFEYTVLESFDHINAGLKDYRKTAFPSYMQFILDGTAMSKMAKIISTIKGSFPRNKVYSAIHSALGESSQGRNEEEFKKRLEILLPPEVITLTEKLRDHFGPAPGYWIHLAELWDYIPGEEV